MKLNRLFAMILAVAMLATMCACGLAEGQAIEVTDVYETQNLIDEALRAEMEAQYDFSEPEVIIDPYQKAPLSAVVLFHTDEEIGGTIAVKGKAEKDTIYGTIEPASDHIVPVIGLYNGEPTQVELTLDDGRTNTLEITTEKHSFDYGERTVNMIDESAYDYSKLTFIYPVSGGAYAVDSAGDIRWYFECPLTQGCQLLENGHLILPISFLAKTLYYSEGIQEIDLTGKVYAQYAIPGGQHHEIRELSNGNLLVATDSPDYSTVEDIVVELDRATGEVVWSLDLKDLLHQDDALAEKMTPFASVDWAHNNGLWYDEANDLLLMSCRVLNAVIAIHKTDKTLAWIISDPKGWEGMGVDESLFFTPVGDDFDWPRGQHEVTMLDNGDIMLFDNGTSRVASWEDGTFLTGEDVFSCAVVFHIDTEAMTIEQVFEYGKERGSQWYSDFMSGVESLDGTKDDLWITAGTHAYNPETNRHDLNVVESLQPGAIKSGHFDHVKNGELVYEMVLVGVQTYRSSRLPAYPGKGYLDVNAVPALMGDAGETPCAKVEAPIEGTAALDSDKWSFERDALKMSVSGAYQAEKASDAVEADYLILQSESEARYYAVTQYKADNDAGCAVSVSGWVSTTLPEGTYSVLVTMDGQVYDTGKTLTIA